MRFLKSNWEVLLLVVLTIASEVVHLLFVDIPFNENVGWNGPVYYFLAQFGLLTFIPSIIIFKLIPDNRKHSKAIAFGLVLWNIKEVIDEICYMLNINSNVFEINNSFWGQIALILTIIILSWIGYYKWKS